MLNNYPLTSFQDELSDLGISTELTRSEVNEQEFIGWKRQREEKSNNQLIRSVLTNAGIDINGNIHEQLQNY